MDTCKVSMDFTMYTKIYFVQFDHGYRSGHSMRFKTRRKFVFANRIVEEWNSIYNCFMYV